MRRFILLGALAAAALTALSCGGLMLIATLMLAASGDSGSSGGYGPYVDPYQGSPPVYYGGPDAGPRDQWSGRMSHGTIDRSGQGGDVYTVDGQVLTLPN